MKITLLCSDTNHPVIPYLSEWMQSKKSMHDIQIVQKASQLSSGTILFLISCQEIITKEIRRKYEETLVLHASDLPKGRGWSPHIWEISRGANHITLSLLEAADQLDSGRIWKKIHIAIPKHALWDEINNRLFTAEISLIDFAIENFGHVEPKVQDRDVVATYYGKRTPSDSKLDVHKSIAEQFDKMRVCDPIRFPAYFDHLGNRYKIKLEKSNEN